MITLLLTILPLLVEPTPESLHQELNRHRLINLPYNESEQSELDRKAKHLETIFGHDHKGLGEPFLGECIWYGRNYREAITDFMNSKGHRKALKDLKAKSVCIGVYQGKESWFVVIRTYEAYKKAEAAQ